MFAFIILRRRFEGVFETDQSGALADLLRHAEAAEHPGNSF
jgi:hypothetical protein